MRGLPVQQVRYHWVEHRLHPMVKLKFTTEPLRYVGHLDILLQRWQHFFWRQDEEFFNGARVDPFLYPAPDGREV